MIPLSVPNLSGREAEYLQACIDSGFVSTAGPYVPQLEARVAEYTGAVAAVSTNTGTAGLHLAMHVLGVEQNDLHHAVFDIHCQRKCDSVAQTADRRYYPETWLLNADLVETLLETKTRAGKRGRIHIETGRCVSAIPVVYTNGLVPEIALEPSPTVLV